MTIWRPNADKLTRPVYRSLAREMMAAIESGDLPVGMRLPTHRALAHALGLSVQTVSRAYDELTRHGVISGEVGRGTFIRGRQGDAQTPWQRLAGGYDIIDCSMLVPVTSDLHSRRMSETLEQLARDVPMQALFSFRPRASLESHLSQATRWLAGCGVSVSADRIVPTNGNTPAMTLALQTAAASGDVIATENLGHHPLKSLAATLGMRIEGLEIDSEGIVPDAFARACRSGPVKVLYVMPSGLSPQCTVMSEGRRRMIAEIAERNDVWIVENDAWGPLWPDRPPTFAALAPSRTLYFTGLTKCVLPGLRVGWLVVPEALVPTARTRHLVTNWMATPLMTEIATRWIEDGTAKAFLRWQRTQLEQRNALATEVLAGLDLRSAPNGMHVWLPLPDAWSEEQFVAHARHEGVAVAAGANFRTGSAQNPPGIRICIGSGSFQELMQGLTALARLARSNPEPALLTL